MSLQFHPSRSGSARAGVARTRLTEGCPNQCNLFCNCASYSKPPPTPKATYYDAETRTIRNSRCKTDAIHPAISVVGKGHAFECACNYGFQCNEGSRTETGVTSTGGATTQCPAGYLCEPTGEDPVKCPKGYFCVEGVDPRSLPKCKPKYFCPEGSTKAEGHPLDGATGCPERTECECAQGYYCPEGSSRNQGYPLIRSTPITLTPSVFAGDTDQTTAECTEGTACKCPPGKWCGAGASAEDMNANNCAPRSFCPETSTAATGNPVEGSTQTNAQCSVGVACTCPAGFYCKSGYGVPRACTPGHHCAAGTDSPATCPNNGYYCPATSTTNKGNPATRTKCPQGTECKCKAGYYCGEGSRDEEGRPKEIVQVTVSYPHPPVVPSGDTTPCLAGYFCPETSTTNKGKPARDDAQCPRTDECQCGAGWYCEAGSTDQTGMGSKCIGSFWCPKTSTTNKGKPAEASSGHVTVRPGTTPGDVNVPRGTYNGDAIGDFGTVNRRRAPSCAPSCASFCSVSRNLLACWSVCSGRHRPTRPEEHTFLAESSRVCARRRGRRCLCLCVCWFQ